MKISTEINSFRKLGDNKKVIKLLKDSGFDAYDFTMFFGGLADEWLQSDDYLREAKEFRAYADAIGIECNQAHAPYPTAIDEEHTRMGMNAAEYNPFAYEKICRAIEVAGVLGAKIIVVHPWNCYTKEQNAKLYLSFESVARKVGVSSEHLSRLFSEKIAGGFHRYIQLLRVEYAKQLLESSDLSIGEIMTESGFCDQRTFNRVFKSFTNFTPRQYRNERIEK